MCLFMVPTVSDDIPRTKPMRNCKADSPRNFVIHTNFMMGLMERQCARKCLHPTLLGIRGVACQSRCLQIRSESMNRGIRRKSKDGSSASEGSTIPPLKSREQGKGLQLRIIHIKKQGKEKRVHIGHPFSRAVDESEHGTVNHPILPSLSQSI